jgi:hypothetical protein
MVVVTEVVRPHDEREDGNASCWNSPFTLSERIMIISSNNTHQN